MEPENQAPPPPEASVIKLARAATGLSVDAAAAAVRGKGGKISASYWGDVERGTGGRRGRRVRVTASARTLAQMAQVLRVTPSALAGAGRQDAADVLGEILRREGPQQPRVPQRPGGAASPVLPDDDPALSVSLRWVRRDLASARERYGPDFTGTDAFPGSEAEAAVWDEPDLPLEAKEMLLAKIRKGQVQSETGLP